MDPIAIMQWESFIAFGVSLGVKSWGVIKNLLNDAGADDALIAALQPKWDALVADIARAAGGTLAEQVFAKLEDGVSPT